jgi:hypothetical protein
MHDGYDGVGHRLRQAAGTSWKVKLPWRCPPGPVTTLGRTQEPDGPLSGPNGMSMDAGVR